MLSDSSTNTIWKIFTDVGLTSQHARVYLAQLKLGPSPVTKIASEAELPRSTCYGLLGDLIREGLTSSTKGTTKALFTPAPPASLTNLVKQKSLIFNKHLEDLDSIGTELTLQYQSGMPQYPGVQLFHGEAGLNTVLYDMLSADELLWICQGSSDVQTSLNTDPVYLQDFLRELKIRKLRTRELLENTPAAREYIKEFSSKRNQIQLLPVRTENIGHVDKVIYSGRIAYISHDSLTGVIIEDKSLYLHEKTLFEDLWKKTTLIAKAPTS